MEYYLSLIHYFLNLNIYGQKREQSRRAQTAPKTELLDLADFMFLVYFFKLSLLRYEIFRSWRTEIAKFFEKF